jgi:site-specific recombinase XerD
MAITKTSTGKWRADVSVGGRLGRGGERIRKVFRTQKEALAFEQSIRGNYAQGKAYDFAYNTNYKLSDLAQMWFEYHGKNLKDGVGRLNILLDIIKRLNNPRFENFNKQQFLQYRNQRTDLTKNTINHHHAYLSSMFNELIRCDVIAKNPIAHIKRLTIDEKELSYLTLDEIDILLSALKQRKSHAYIIAKVCLSIGSRWGEAQALTPKNVKNGILTLGSKNNKLRKLPIDKELEKEILENAPFTNGYNTFKRVIKGLDFDLPKGQATHILRHSFASHFIMNGGDILTLQKTLGHSDLKMTMRYAHLSPDHLKNIVKLNPLSSFSRHFNE